MSKSQVYFDSLRQVLRDLHSPENLDAHPWTQSRFVQDLLASRPELVRLSPGRRLAYAVESVFQQTMPSTPPRQGKRLDTRWGEFGILAAQYFAPIRFGTSNSSSLRDAWGRIDQAILLYAFGNGKAPPSDSDISAYKLVGNEIEITPDSTLSDWHRKGLQRLAGSIQAREEYLEQAGLSKDGRGRESRQAPSSGALPRRRSRWTVVSRLALFLLFSLFVAAVVLGGLKARKVYDQALVVRQDLEQLQGFAALPANLDQVKQAGTALSTLRRDFDALEAEVEPALWLAPWLDWVPTYGGDLASAQDLFILADSMLATADGAYRAALPVAESFMNGNGKPGLHLRELTEAMAALEPQWVAAQQTLDQAAAARSRLDLGTLSPFLRDLVESKADPALALLSDSLTLAMEIPRVLGATSQGPKTYLLLVQNEDELRPTGGFITAAGTLLVQNGEILHVAFEDSGNFDNWSRPYPTAPWQLDRYMNSPVLIFRDANWFTDYPTTALYAEYLYSFNNDHSVDGVIAFDQQMLVELLGVLGPLEVEDAPYLIDANNVVAYMRAAKTPTEAERLSPDWNNKAFINELTYAVITRVFEDDLQWEQLAAVLVKTLDEHHLLAQLDNPSLTAFLDRQGWDGRVEPGEGDFLMVVDFNVGFNKTNALVETGLAYDVDLSNPLAPVGRLAVTHKNRSTDKIACLQWRSETLSGQENYPMDRCYWDYMRVYTPLGARLIQATPQAIPAGWTLLNRPIPPQVDLLGEEIEGSQAFGTLKVVPGGQAVTTGFEFALPARILKLQPDTGRVFYRLKIQKQPGTLAVPVSLSLLLPDGSPVITVPPGATVEGRTIKISADLRGDLEFEIVFALP
ncbi:MAG: DUF4012 domain-containing protein [Chloroflexota bacterium]